MYRCEICNHCSKPGEARRVHVIQRSKRRRTVVRHRSPFGNWVTVSMLEVGTEIATEIALCGRCQADLQECGSLHHLLDVRRQDKQVSTKTRGNGAMRGGEAK